MEVQMEFLEKERVKELEILHNVDIQTDAVNLACSIVVRYCNAIVRKGEEMHHFAPDAETLKVEALQLLEKACLELHVKDEELTRFDREGYLMFRNLVELAEFWKDRPRFKDRHIYLSFLEKEDEMLRHSWDQIVEKCKSVLLWQKNPHRMVQLVQLKERVSRILKSEIAGDEIINLVEDIHNLLYEYKGSIPASVMHYRTVSPNTVAKIASSLTGVPISWLLNSFQPPVTCLGDRLARKVTGQDYAMKRFVNFLSRPGPQDRGPSPLASFLFLLGSSIGIKNIFESLAEELYDSKDRLIWFDLHTHSHGPSTSAMDLRKQTSERNGTCRAKWDAIEAKVLEVVKSTPFCVLLFDEVNGCEYGSGFLKRILRDGKLVDNQGNTHDLSNTLIIMTSIIYVGQKRDALFCNCKEMNCTMVEDEMRTISSKDPECDRLAAHKKLLGSLWDIHELVDDVLVLNGIPALFNEALTIRQKLRKVIDASRENQQLILYPSEACVRFISMGYRGDTAKCGLKLYIKKKVIAPILSDINQIEAGKMAIIRIDVLVRVYELYYRSLEVDGALEAFKESLSRWRTVYQNEKGFTQEVVKLMAAGSQLLSQVQNMKEQYHVMIWLKDVENVIDGIISDPILSGDFVSEQRLVPPSTIEARVASRLTNCSDSSIMEDLIMSNLGEKYKLLNFIADVVTSNGSNGPLHHQPKCFLFLGLTDNAKAELVKALCHVFESLYGHESIIQINMEEYTKRNSVMKFLDHISVLALDGLSGNGSSLSDCTLTSPSRIMLIDRVGEAHLSVFSAILSLLDHGVLKNREGTLVDFCRTVVIITSDLGDKKVLARVAGHGLGSMIKEEKDKQRTEKPFPYELLNRVDEIVMFDPLLEPQLETFFRIKIEVPEQSQDILGLLMYLFFDSDNVPAEKESLFFGMAIKMISYAIAKSRNAAPLTKRKYLEA